MAAVARGRDGREADARGRGQVQQGPSAWPLASSEASHPVDPRARHHPSLAYRTADRRPTTREGREPHASAERLHDRDHSEYGRRNQPAGPQHTPRIQTQHLPAESNRFSWTKTPLHAESRPVYTLDSSSPTTIDESSPTSDRTGTGTGTNSLFSHLAAAVASDIRAEGDPASARQTPATPPPNTSRNRSNSRPTPSPGMPSPEGTRATYSLYPRDRPPPERVTTPQSAQKPAENYSTYFPPYADAPEGTRVSPDRVRTPRQQDGMRASPERVRTPGQLESRTMTPERTRTPAAADAPMPSPERVRTPGSVPGRQQSPLQQYQHRRSMSGPQLRVQTVGPDTPASPPYVDAKQYPYASPPLPHSEQHHPYPPPIPGDGKDSATTPSMSTPHLTPRTPTYDPHALMGPNVADPAERHLPGQISHPNAAVTPSWQHGLCAADGVCFEALCCPCLVYGRTQYRLDQKSRRKEATDLNGYHALNGSCAVMTLACGFQWVLALIQRTRVRKLYAIDGSVGQDCATAFCCCTCVLAQDEREVRAREQRLRRFAGPAVSMLPYASPREDMRYDPPPR